MAPRVALYTRVTAVDQMGTHALAQQVERLRA